MIIPNASFEEICLFIFYNFKFNMIIILTCFEKKQKPTSEVGFLIISKEKFILRFHQDSRHIRSVLEQVDSQ